MEDAGRMVLSAAGDLVAVAAFRTCAPCVLMDLKQISVGGE